MGTDYKHVLTIDQLMLLVTKVAELSPSLATIANEPPEQVLEQILFEMFTRSKVAEVAAPSSVLLDMLTLNHNKQVMVPEWCIMVRRVKARDNRAKDIANQLFERLGGDDDKA